MIYNYPLCILHEYGYSKKRILFYEMKNIIFLSSVIKLNLYHQDGF